MKPGYVNKHAILLDMTQRMRFPGSRHLTCQARPVICRHCRHRTITWCR